MIAQALAAAFLLASPAGAYSPLEGALWEKAVAERIACGTFAPRVFEPQFHENDPQCPYGLYCWGDDGRPALPEEQVFDTPGGAFRIHYTFEGYSAVLPADRDENGLPDYVDKVAQAFDESLVMFRELGFREPQLDKHGGNERVDVYLSWAADFGGAAYWDGHSPNTRPEYPGATPVFITINPVQHAFADEVLPDWMGDLLIRQVVLHELHHAVQMGYGYGGASWVLEAMSVMMEQELLDIPRAFPFVTDLRYSLRYRFPHETLLQPYVSRLGYANGLFYSSLLMDMGGSPAGLAEYWDAIGRNSAPWYDVDGPDAFEQVSEGLAAAGLGTLREAYRRFTLRELFLGAYDDGKHFKDGFRYHPPDGSVRSQTFSKAGTLQTPLLEPYGHTFFRIDAPAGAQVGLIKAATPDTEWDWVQQHADCTTTVTVIEPATTYAALPVEGNDHRAWLVVRHFGASASTFSFTVTAAARNPVAPQKTLAILDAPASVSAGTEFPVIARLSQSDCRLIDVSTRATWSAAPVTGFNVRAGGALRLDEPGEVIITAEYAGAVSSVTVVVEGDSGTPPGSKKDEGEGGCASASATSLWMWLFLGWWVAFRRNAAPSQTSNPASS